LIAITFMPEAAAILFVLTVCAGIFIYARVQALDPSKRDPVAELRQLKLQHAWLTEQVQRAQQEKWDQQMISRLSTQLEDATRKLKRTAPVAGGNPLPSEARP
jgi:hypothetical protein